MRSRATRPFGTGGPLAYVAALVVVALTLGPVLYGALGGFRSNEQIAREPAGLPDPWLLRNYEGVLKLDGEVGNKKQYDPRAWGKEAEAALSARVVEACEDLRSAGTHR